MPFVYGFLNIVNVDPNAHPEHPIVLPPAQPPGIWGGGNQPFPTPPIHIPPTQRPPGVPTHPIYYPPGIWGGANEPFPTPPIYFPPEGGKPPGTWGGAGEPFPTPPIELPPGLPPTTGDDRPIDWKVAWTPQTGWIVVGIPNVDHPVPSKE